MNKRKLDPTDISGLIDELDQSAFFRQPQPPEPIAKNPEIPISGNQEIPKSRNEEYQKSGNPEIPISRKEDRLKVPKYYTQLPLSLQDEIKVYAVRHRLKDYEVVIQALEDFFKKQS